MQPGDGPRVAFVDIVLVESSFGAGAVVAVGLVDIAFFGADPESGGLVVGEVERRNGYFPCLVVACVDQLEGFLSCRCNHIQHPASCMGKEWRDWDLGSTVRT